MIIDIDRAEHILEANERIDHFIFGVDLEDFLSNEQLMFACYANVIIIAEAASKITRGKKKKIENIEWQLITKFRNIIIHEYFRINWRLIWDVIKNNLTALKQEMQIIIGK